MIPEPIARPEQSVIADIDALIDEQLRLGEHWARGEDHCPLCGGPWHGLPGDGPPQLVVGGTPGAESYTQVGNGGIPGCPGAHATDEQARAWLARMPRPDARPPMLEPMQFPRDGSREYGPRALAALRRILLNMSQALAPIIGTPDLSGWGIEAGPVTEDGDNLEASFTLHPPGLADGPIIRFWDADMHEIPADRSGVFLPDGTLDPNMLEGFQELGTLVDDGLQMAWERGGVVFVDQVRNVEITPAPSGGYTLADIETLRNEIWARAPHPGLRCYQCRRHLEPEHALLGTGPNTYWCLECADNYTQAHLRELQR